MNRRHALGLTFAGLGIASGVLRAQTAELPIRLVVPVPAGGASDMAARAVAQTFLKQTGQSVLVENRPGASGAVAAQAVMSANADGKTLLWTLSSMTAIPLLQKASPYQTLAEFAPIGLVGRFTYGLFVSNEVPARTVGELTALMRARPGNLNCAYGTLGDYMAAAQFAAASASRFEYVPYKGGAQLMPDLIAGRVHFNFGPIPNGIANVRAGKLRMLAALAPKRSVLAPDVPTLSETGIATGPLPTWQAILAPPRTPAESTARLAKELGNTLREPALRSQLEQLALVPEEPSPAELRDTIAQDLEVWRRFIREQNIPTES